MDYPVKFYIISNNFPILQEGILGRDFLVGCSGNFESENRYVLWNGIKIPFTIHESIMVPTRSITTFCIKISNSEANTGFMPRLYLGKGTIYGKRNSKKWRRKSLY